MFKKIFSKNNHILGVAFGSLLGLLYWDLVGCENGTCAITSVWWKSAIYGALLGWLVEGIIRDNKKHQNG